MHVSQHTRNLCLSTFTSSIVVDSYIMAGSICGVGPDSGAPAIVMATLLLSCPGDNQQHFLFDCLGNKVSQKLRPVAGISFDYLWGPARLSSGHEPRRRRRVTRLRLPAHRNALGCFTSGWPNSSSALAGR